MVTTDSGNLSNERGITMTILHSNEAKNLISGILLDFAQDDLENLIPYLEHVGFDIAAIQTGKELLPAWLGHYRIGQGTYDIDRALLDFTTWPPIAREIFRLLAEKAKTESLAK